MLLQRGSLRAASLTDGGRPLCFGRIDLDAGPSYHIGLRHVEDEGGDPVVQLQTNFGGGKTHSMLALYHLFSGANAADLAGLGRALAELVL